MMNKMMTMTLIMKLVKMMDRFGSRDGCITQGAVRGIEIPNSFSPPA